jgi:hypothetical protein
MIQTISSKFINNQSFLYTEAEVADEVRALIKPFISSSPI